MCGYARQFLPGTSSPGEFGGIARLLARLRSDGIDLFELRVRIK
jgi:hypothetical protein